MRKFFVVFTVLLLFVAAAFVVTNDGIGGSRKKGEKGGGQSVAKTFGITRPFWTPNRIGDYITNNGQLVSHIPTNSAGMEWPLGSHNTINFASGIWIAGKKNGEIVASAGEYVVEFQPGPIQANGQAANPQLSQYRVYIINQSDVEDPASNIDYQQWPYTDGAPFLLNADGSKSPGLIGTSTAWCVFNDLDANLHARLFSTKVMGIEVQQTAWAFNRPDAFGDMLFFKFNIINKSGVNITDAYVSFWADVDIGDAADLVGCDTTLSLGFNYKTQADGLYGTSAPAIGYDFFQGPIVRGAATDTARVSGRKVPGFKNLGLSAFSKYINSGPPQLSDPETGPEAYSFMQGLDKLGGQIINPQTNKVTKFFHPGDPVAHTGWLDDVHADKRFLMTTGPFTLAAGDAQEVVGGMVIAQGPDAPSTIRLLKQADQSAQAAYDNNFVLPKSPPSPVVQVTQEKDAILLKWDAKAAAYNEIDNFHVDPSGNKTFYKFQGYNVYQVDELSIGTATTIKKVATFDVVDGVTEIHDDVDEPNLGQRVNIVVQKGTDSGISQFARISKDAIRSNAPLIQNRRYYFAVTAYGYNEYGVPKVLESTTKPILAIPQSPALGSKLSAVYNDTLKTTHTGTTDGSVIPIVVDPSALTGDSYELKFRSTTGGTVYDVLKKGAVVDAGRTNQGAGGEFNYPLVDGILVQVFGPPPGMKGFQIPAGARRWTFVGADGFGLEGLSGAIGLAQLVSGFFNNSPVTPDKARNVLIKLAGTDVDGNVTDPNDPDWSFAYRYLRGATAPAAKPEFAPFIINKVAGYAYQEFKKSIPFAAYDIETTPPRRLAVGHLENNVAGGLVDGKYWPPFSDSGVDNAAGSGPREWFFIFDTNYSETPNAALQGNILGSTFPIMWFGTPNRRGGNIAFTAPDEFLIVANHVNSPANVYSFQSTKPTVNDLALAKDQIKLVNVFPNPYAGLNIEERDPVNRFVTFTHLSPTAKIRIFTLSGELVRIINHNDGTQLERWDLRNSNDIPVASGIYIAHIELPGMGQKVLKLAVFQPEERLDVF